MGEIAEMMLGGLMCEGCGEFMDDFEEPGHPRRCLGCAPARGRPARATPGAPRPHGQGLSRSARRRRARREAKAAGGAA